MVLPSMLDADGCASSCSLWVGGLALDAEADDCVSSCSLWVGGLALDARCRRLRVHLPAGLARPLALCGSVVLHSMPKPMIACPLARRSCASDRAHVVFVGRWSCLRCSMPMPMLMLMLMIARPLARRSLWICGLARPLARRSCASSGFPYCQKTALELQALDRASPSGSTYETTRISLGLRLPVGRSVGCTPRKMAGMPLGAHRSI